MQSRLVRGARGTDDDLALRAGIAAAALVGVVFARHVVRVPVLASAEREALVPVLAPAVDAVLLARDPG